VRPPLSPRAEATFNSALERPPAEREAYVAEACGDETLLLAEVRGLLAAHAGAGGFMAGDPTFSPEAEHDLARLKPEESGEMIGPYKLREQIGEGGFGTVWVADQDKPVRRRVALKIIKLGMDTREVIARFEQERQALAMMDHPNIAKVLDAGATQFRRPSFVMELVRGVKITEYCDEQQLSTPQRIELFITVCQAVQHAHQKGIIHRDLKPSNILVTINDGKAVPKVIDFGVAKATQGRLTDQTVYTQFQQMIGTPLYMSPEQAEMTSLDIDTRSDIYSLGVLLYELLTGSTPIAQDTLARAGLDEIRRIIREVDPPRPSTRMKTLDGAAMTAVAARRNTEPAKLPATLRGDIDWIVMKCLEKDRRRRYDTANGLALDLQRHLRNEVVIARPPTAGYLLSKLIRRNQFAFAAGAAIAASLVIGIAASLWQAVRATRAEREQSQLRAVAVQALDGEKAQRTQAEAEWQRAEANAENARATALQSRRNQYAADIFSSTINIEEGSYATARNFLREYFFREGAEDLRGFEWRYWWQLSAGQQLKTFPVSRDINHAAWSPDGRLTATAHGDGKVRLVRSDSGEVVATFQDCGRGDNSVAFSSDGNGLATAGWDAATGQDVVRFWDVRDGRLLFTLTPYPSPRVACSPAGPRMAIGTGGDLWGQSGKEVHLMDTTTGQELRVLPQSGDRAAFSPDGRQVATANWGRYESGTQAVILWDVESGEKLHILPDIRQVQGMAFSPDGSLLAIGTRSGQVILWNLHDFSHVTLREATGDYARALSFSPDGQSLAVGLQSLQVEIWNVPDRRQVQSLRGHTGDIPAVAYSPDGTQLASSSLDGTIRLWDPHPPPIQHLVPGLTLEYYLQVGNPRFSPDSRWAAVSMESGDVKIVDPSTAGWEVRKVLPNAGNLVAFSSDAATLLTLRKDGKTLQRWDVLSGSLLSTTTLASREANWRFSIASQDGGLLALADAHYHIIEIFETRTGRRLGVVQNPTFTGGGLEFSPDGQWLAIGGEDTFVLWDLAAGRVVRTMTGHTARVTAIRFSPDRKTIASTSWDGTVRFWEAATGKPLAVLTGHKAGVVNGVFSPDGRTFVSASDDRCIKFWNLAAFREVASIQFTYQPSYLGFSPDGRILAGSDGNGGLRCWRAPTLAEIDAAEAQVKAASQKP